MRSFWRRGRIALAGVLAVAVLTAACGGGDDDNDSASVPAPAATSAAVSNNAASTASAAATSAATQAAQSRVFTDAAGKQVEIKNVPKRVVALSPSLVEMMYAVNAPPIARPSSARVPDAANALPAVGTSYQPNLEQIAAQTPDLILADAQLQSPQVQAELANFGAPVFSIRVLTVDDVTKGLRQIGAIMGKTEDGEKAAKAIDDKLANIQSKLPPQSERPKVFVLVGTPDQFWGAKPDSFAGDVVARLGANNLVQGGADSGPLPGFTTYSVEKVVEIDPDVILVLSIAGPNAPPTSRLLQSNPAWANLRAVKNGRVHEASADALVQSAGPRVSEQIDQIAPWLYPGRF